MDNPSKEDLEAIKKIMLLPMVMRVLERDSNVLLQSKLKTKAPYLTLVRRVSEMVQRDIVLAKKEIRTRGIHIYDYGRNEETYVYKYTYKNYHHTGSFTLAGLKQEVEQLLDRYFGN